MAQARKIGTEYAITGAVTEIITIPVGDEGAGQTLINDGTSAIFWREYDPTVTLTGAAAVLVATPIFASRLEPNEYTHQAGITIVAVCDTDQQETSTLRVAPGRLYQGTDVDMAADIAALLAALGDTDGLVYSPVVIEEAAAVIKDLGVGAGTEYVRLHALVCTMRAQGTLQYHSDTDGAGAGESDLSGPMAFGAGGGINMPFDPDPRGKPTSVIAEHMTIQAGVAGFDGYAIISKGV